MFNINIMTTDYMSIIVTHECNKKCKFCVDKYKGERKYIKISDVYKSLDYAKKRKKIKDVLLVGGEPTLHRKIIEIAMIVKSYGFNLIVTTNYSRPEIVKNLDVYVDSFNVSFYNQKILPSQNNFTADITLSALITKEQLQTKKELDGFIDLYKDKYILKFSTLTICNDYTKKNQRVDYLDGISEKNVILFGELVGNFYRGYIIKRYDKIIYDHESNQSLKCHVNGNINYSWDREG